MTNSKKTLITTRSSEILIVRQTGQKTLQWFCADCEAETEMLDFNSAVTVFRIGARELIRQIETGAIHSTETASGHLFACSQSLQIARLKLKQ